MTHCVKITLNLPDTYKESDTTTIGIQIEQIVVKLGVKFISCFERGQNQKLHFHIVYQCDENTNREDNEKRKFAPLFKSLKIKMIKPTFDIQIKPTLKYKYDGFQYQIGYCQKERHLGLRVNTNMSAEELQQGNQFYIDNHVDVEFTNEKTYHTINEISDEIVSWIWDNPPLIAKYVAREQFSPHLNEKDLSQYILDDFLTQKMIKINMTLYKQLYGCPLYSYVTTNIKILKNKNLPL